MSDLKINGQHIGATNIYELKEGMTAAQARQKTDQDGRDQVYFRHEGKEYVAVGDELNLSGISGDVPTIIEFDDGETQIQVESVGIDDEIGSVGEGWEKGVNLLDSVLGAAVGFFVEKDYQAVKDVTTQTAIVKLPEGGTQKPIEVFFSKVFSGDMEVAKNDPESIDKKLIKYLDTATETMDLALFELHNEGITEAIERAHERGVTVRIVTDDKFWEKKPHDLDHLKSLGIEIIDDNRSGLMHNKFVVIDGESIWTGSMNTTDNGVWKNNNNAVIVRSDELAENYTTEFEEMFIHKKFGRRSPNDTPNPIVQVGNIQIQNYFASEGDVARIVAEEISRAQNTIHFMAFSFTEDGIGQAVLDKHNEWKDIEGKEVRGVFENFGAGSKYGEFGKLKEAGAEVKVDGNKGIMHHKVFILDEETVIMGSYNFSNSADSKNDENIMIIKDKEIAQMYMEEFERVYEQGKFK